MKKIIPALIVGFFLISSPLVGAYKPEGVKTRDTMDVTAKLNENVTWLDRIGQSLDNLFAVGVQEEQYEPGDTAEGEIWGYVGAVASDEEEADSLYGHKCDFDTKVAVCVYIQDQDDSVPAAVDCVDVPMECGDLSRTSWSAEIYDGADEGTYDVYAKYMFKYLRSWREKYDYGSDTIEVKEVTEHAYKKCYNDNVYWYDSEDNRGEIYKRCNDVDEGWKDWKCVDDKTAKRKYVREEEYCNNGECKEDESVVRTGTKTCSGSQICKGGQCIERHYRRTCYQGDVYWKSELGKITDKYEECGSDSCGDWGSGFCAGDKVKQERTCYNRGCSNDKCTVETSTKTKTVKTCSGQRYGDRYCSAGDNVVKDMEQQTCLGGSCQWKVGQEAAKLVEKCKYGCSNGVCGEAGPLERLIYQIQQFFKSIFG